jgi:hypothetical protein
MAKDIIVSESELVIARSRLVSYMDFLVTTMQSYSTVVANIQARGAIQDKLICSKLTTMAGALNPCINSLQEECASISKDVNDYITRISKKDKFKVT